MNCYKASGAGTDTFLFPFVQVAGMNENEKTILKHDVCVCMCDRIMMVWSM